MAAAFCGKRLLLIRSNLFASARRAKGGYIVLVPEIGENLPAKNPLLKPDGLPEFNSVTIEKCISAIGQQAIVVEKNVRGIEENVVKKSYGDDVIAGILLPLEATGMSLESTWGVAKTLYLGNSSRMPTKRYMTIHERARGARRTKFNSVPIYRALATLDERSLQQLTEEERRLVRMYVVESKLNGIEVSGSAKLELNEVMDKLTQERSKFNGKREVALKKYKQVISDLSVMREFPATALKSVAADPSQVMKGPWLVTLQPFVVNAFLEHCPDRTLRWNLWQADTRKCSTHTDKSLENSSHLENIRALRLRQAKLLGYENYVAMSMETKMANGADGVRSVLDALHAYARPALEQEMTMLERFAAENGSKQKLDIYDVPYWKRRHLLTVHQFDQEVLRDYFSMPTVLAGLFALAEQLFGVKMVERTGVDVWHEDVRFYDVFNVDQPDEPIASFYTDFYCREDEKVIINDNTCWMVGIVNRSRAAASRPLIALICNMPAPLYGKPSLLSMDDVQILFHKFGHGLQCLLTQCSYSDVAGTSNVEWDAVEVGGHVMTHLLHDTETLRSISAHYSTGEPVPDLCIEAIQKRRKHLAGYALCRELYFADLDLQLHLKGDYWLDLVKALYPKYHTFPLDKKDAHPCSMTSIFSGDWGAAYYSRLWSRMIAADVYSAFAEAKDDEAQRKEVGRRYRETFLALGGGCHPLEVFRRFRGRDPSPNALLQTLGIYKPHIHGVSSSQKGKED